ncbi:TetR/AcrR family transcriptional regulator [Sphingopyxis sp.]|uniref:TetR/AcrR family transcriptional regulator n=1 Tax=Sphingopyxis sp. TaxID=1908224 RepID=UPI002D7778C6|nr:TetR family transcriptional regulator [Sphingopyxis sp.]HET6525165.1 TetR family transcriptional regulator [Sphingopyxis sp.]
MEIEAGAPGPSPTIEPGSIKERMVLIGEVQFAENGINGASMREIASKAGQRNHYAVQYHFGSREGLVRAIFDYRMKQMEPRREEMLRQAEQQNLLLDARALLDIVMLPQLDLEDIDGNHSYASFLSQYLLRSQSTEFGDFGSESPPHLQRVLDLLRERLFYLPTAVAQRRLVNGCLMFLNMLVSHRGSASTDDQEESFEHAVEDTMEMLVTSICMPLRTSRHLR